MFGIPYKEKEVFNRNFINNVSFEATFAPNRNCTTKRNDIAASFETELPVKHDAVSQQIEVSFDTRTKSNSISTKQDENDHRLVMSAKNGQKQFELTNISVKYQESGASYKDQQDFDEKIDKVLSFLRDADVKEFTKTILRKVNIVTFNTRSGDDRAPAVVYSAVQDLISPKLLSSFQAFSDSMPYMKQHMSTMVMEDEDSILTVRYGYVIDSKSEDGKQVNGRVIVDLQMAKQTRTNVDEVAQLLGKYHQELYNVFHWCISDHMQEILRGNI